MFDNAGLLLVFKQLLNKEQTFEIAVNSIFHHLLFRVQKHGGNEEKYQVRGEGKGKGGVSGGENICYSDPWAENALITLRCLRCRSFQVSLGENKMKNYLNYKTKRKKKRKPEK